MSRQPRKAEGLKRVLRSIDANYRLLTAPFRGLPAALIIGTQKGGTTSLFNYLVQHPKIRASFGKEIHYFDLNYDRGVKWYRGRFPYRNRLRDGALAVDASPYYLMHPLVPERAARLLPDAKLISLLRNPIERAYSHYQHEVRGGRESLSFDEALDNEPARLAGEEERLMTQPGYYSWNHHRYSYTKRGLYLEQLRRWLQHFPREQLLVLQSEWLFRDPAAACATVYQFLDLPPQRLQRYRTFLDGKYERTIPTELRSRLAAYFAPHNRELFQFLGQEFDWD